MRRVRCLLLVWALSSGCRSCDFEIFPEDFCGDGEIKGNVHTCEPWSGGENDSRFYNNGLLAYLNVFGQILAEEPSDPNGICKWLPSAYARQFDALGFGDLNGFVWGKQSGQALAFAGETVAAIERCP